MLLHQQVVVQTLEPFCACDQGITISDCSHPEMPLIYANEAFTRITGYSLDETLGKNCRFLQVPLAPTACVLLLTVLLIP